MTYICVSKLTIIGLDNGLSPGWCQAIIWTNDGMLLIGLLETNQWNLNRNLHSFSQENPFENVVRKLAAILSWPQCVNIAPLLTHLGRVTHICVGKSTIIGSDNGLSPDRRQAIIWTNAGILLIGPIGTYFSEILTGSQTFSFKKMHLKMSSAKWRPFCLGLNVLTWVICVSVWREQ